jgi:hypothetical protein
METVKTLAIALLICLGQITFAQESVENPTAIEDIKVVTDYIDALMTNKMDLVTSLVADAHVGIGPANGDTQTKTELVATWKEWNKLRTNQKNDYVRNSFSVVGGDLAGDWVSVWGTYSFTEKKMDIVLPYQYSAQVENGKILRSAIYYDNLAIAEMRGYELTAKKN